MARILFTWELGAGIGHIVRHRPLMKGLLDAGHEIWFAMRSLQHAEMILGDLNIKFLQAPTNRHNTVDPKDPIYSYAHLLHNVIFHSTDLISKTIKDWQEIFEMVKPHLLIADHSPGALLASRGMSTKTIHVGTGFTVPPNNVEHMRNLRDWMPCEQAALEKDEKTLLMRMNAAVNAAEIPELSSLSDLFVTDDQFLMTFAETDHIKGRTQASYCGVNISEKGIEPEWPDVIGKRIFAYLKDFETLPSLLETLRRSKQPCLVYYQGANKEEVFRYASDSLHFIDKPVNVRQTAVESDLAITHAGHNTALEFLLAGKPQMFLPLHLEQYLLAERIAEMGAGLNAPLLKPKGMETKLHALLVDDSYKDNAMKFSQKYKDFNPEDMYVDMLRTIGELLPKEAFTKV